MLPFAAAAGCALYSGTGGRHTGNGALTSAVT